MILFLQFFLALIIIPIKRTAAKLNITEIIEINKKMIAKVKHAIVNIPNGNNRRKYLL